jgi:transposase InsO family protein
MPSKASRWIRPRSVVASRRELLNCRGSIWRSSAAALSLTGLGAGAAHAEHLECELIDRRPIHSEARIAVFQFTEGFYNPSRRQSTLGYLSPVEYEVNMIA